MPIILKTRDGGQISCATHRLSRLAELPFYNDIIYIKVVKGAKAKGKEHEEDEEDSTLPETLPTRLQMLICPDCSLTKLPPLPESLLVLQASNNRIKQFPPVHHLHSLETVCLAGNSITRIEAVCFPSSLKTLDLSDNILETFSVAQWPHHLVSLNLSTNRLVELDPSFDDLNRTCKVSVTYNDFPPQKHNAFTVWINPRSNDEQLESAITYVRRYARFGIRVRVHGMADDEIVEDGPPQPPLPQHRRQQIQETIRNLERRPAASALIYTDGQNVHAGSVQRSTDSSVAWLIENGERMYAEEYVNSSSTAEERLLHRNQAIHELKTSWRPKFYEICKWIRTWQANKALRKNIAEETIHSVHGISYGDLLSLVWQAIKTHEHRKEILSVLQQEILESRNLCFTGRFTRTLNALSGFIEQVNVQISENEQMSHRIVQCLKQVAIHHKQGNEAYERLGKIEVNKILDEFDMASAAREPWLDAI